MVNYYSDTAACATTVFRWKVAIDSPNGGGLASWPNATVGCYTYPPTASPTTSTPTAPGGTFAPTASPTNGLPGGCGYGVEGGFTGNGDSGRSTVLCATSEFCCVGVGLQSWAGAVRAALTNQTTGIGATGNQLSSIPVDGLAGLTSLSMLVLETNVLSSLPTGLFAGLGSLVQLSLQNNRLSMIAEGLFAGLHNLSQLNLGRNRLSTIAAGAFGGLSSLGYLALDSNELTTIEHNALNGLRALRLLRLQSNMLTALPTRLVWNCIALQVLDVSYNRIVRMPVSLVAPHNFWHQRGYHLQYHLQSDGWTCGVSHHGCGRLCGVASGVVAAFSNDAVVCGCDCVSGCVCLSGRAESERF